MSGDHKDTHHQPSPLEVEVSALRDVVEDLRLEVRRLSNRIVGGNGEGLVSRMVKMEQWVASCRWVGGAILTGVALLTVEAVTRWFASVH